MTGQPSGGNAYDPPEHTTMLRRDRGKIAVDHGDPTSDRPRSGEPHDDPRGLTGLWDAPEHLATTTGLQEKLLDALVAKENLSQKREAHW